MATTLPPRWKAERDRVTSLDRCLSSPRHHRGERFVHAFLSDEVLSQPRAIDHSTVSKFSSLKIDDIGWRAAVIGVPRPKFGAPIGRSRWRLGKRTHGARSFRPCITPPCSAGASISTASCPAQRIFRPEVLDPCRISFRKATSSACSPPRKACRRTREIDESRLVAKGLGSTGIRPPACIRSGLTLAAPNRETPPIEHDPLSAVSGAGLWPVVLLFRTTP